MSAGNLDLSQSTQAWTDVRASAEAVDLEAELAREVSADYVLAGRPVTAVAVRKLRKEVVSRLADDEGWAWVHLSWNAESDPAWPSTPIVETWEHLVDLLREGDRA